MKLSTGSSTAGGLVLWGEPGMYSEPVVQVNMDYPVRVATKLKFAGRWRVVGEVAEAKVCESLASRK